MVTHLDILKRFFKNVSFTADKDIFYTIKVKNREFRVYPDKEFNSFVVAEQIYYPQTYNSPSYIDEKEFSAGHIAYCINEIKKALKDWFIPKVTLESTDKLL